MGDFGTSKRLGLRSARRAYQSTLRSQTPIPNPAVQSRSAPFRVGLIGGIVLAIAMAAEQLSVGPDGASIGWLIITGGMGLTGYYAAREAGVINRNQGARAGAIAGLIVGICVALAFVASLLFRSLDPALYAQFEKQLQQQYSPQQMQAIKDSGMTIRMLIQIGMTISVSCCGVLLPAMSMLLGMMGGVGAGRIALEEE
jgi:hypothetical protein